LIDCRRVTARSGRFLGFAFCIGSVALFGSACFESALDVDTAAGTYVLESVDDEVLPVVLDEGTPDEVTVSAGVLNVEADGSASASLTTSDGVETKGGTWTRSNTSVYLSWSDGVLEAGIQVGDTFSLTLFGVTYLYRRAS
jgi:hypothetical protein